MYIKNLKRNVCLPTLHIPIFLWEATETMCLYPLQNRVLMGYTVSNLHHPITIRQCMFDRKIGAAGSVLHRLCHFVILTIRYLCYDLWNQLLLELSLDLFKTLYICYRYIEDVHKEVWCWKNIFRQFDRVFNLAIFWQLHLVNNGW